ncbi:hypothetical protein Efla_002659 [Eimeria flavescens]
MTSVYTHRLSPKRSSLTRVLSEGLDEDVSLVDCTRASAPPCSSVAEEPAVLSGGIRTRCVLMGLSLCLCVAFVYFLPLKDLLREVVELQRDQPATHFVQRSEQLQAIDAALRADSLKLVMCTRMVLPFTFNNYFLGTTSVSAATFAFATVVTGIPFALLYAIIGGELQNLESALSVDAFEIKRADVDFFGFCTVTKRQLEVSGICAGVCLFFFLIRTVKQFADRVLAETEYQTLQAGQQPPSADPSSSSGAPLSFPVGPPCMRSVDIPAASAEAT